MGTQDYLAQFFVALRPGAIARTVLGGTRHREIAWKGGDRPYATIVTIRKDRNPAVMLERATRTAALEFWVCMLNAVRPEGKRSGLFRNEIAIQNAAAQIALNFGSTLLPSFIELRIRLLEEADLDPAREAYALPASRKFGLMPRTSAVLYLADRSINQAKR